MAQALYRKWRSQTFDQVVGQEHVITTLRNALRDNRVAHAYLFAGPRGTGKTSIARILAKALNCTAPEGERPCDQCPTCVAITEGRMLDLIEIDAASNNSVDDIRDLRDKVNFRPSEGRFKVYIIDEVHMLSISAFNALLKTLEEPPPHARFMLATTEPHKIPATILSRCQRFDLRRIAVPEIVNHLHYIAKEEGFTAEDEALTAIARGAQGCMRDAISLLDQMLSYGNET
ncbi:MAG: DNA polymerase III subunit gamma/tau, partial [Caldilineaceae bacterium]|nr:DNA polymerase III subunit gamma/tau [Caldilineaceae bacterium]